jgi:hypothetical protein
MAYCMVLFLHLRGGSEKAVSSSQDSNRVLLNYKSQALPLTTCSIISLYNGMHKSLLPGNNCPWKGPFKFTDSTVKHVTMVLIQRLQEGNLQ